jgi:hypothetical protein
MYAGKQVFLAVGILIISILILYIVKYSNREKITEGFAAASLGFISSYPTGLSAAASGQSISTAYITTSSLNTNNFWNPVRAANGDYSVILSIPANTKISSVNVYTAVYGDGAHTPTTVYLDFMNTNSRITYGTGSATFKSTTYTNLSGYATFTINTTYNTYYPFLQITYYNPYYQVYIHGLSATGSLICPAGQYTNSTGSCSTCTAGTYSASGATSCSACGSGTYASGTGQASCTTCPANSTCTATSFTCNTGFVLSGTSCQKVTCPAGQYLNGSTCTACPSSTYQPQSGFTGNSCKAIPPTNVESSTPSSVTCATGYTLSSDGSQCLPNSCTEGVNYNNVTGKSPCRVCPLNSKCTVTGYTCDTGYSQLGNGCAPNLCEKDTYSITGKIPCTPCETGYTNTGPGSIGLSTCKITLQPIDILNKLNYSPTNIPGQFYGLTLANINVTSPQTFTQDQTINYISYITPVSLVTAAAINYINGTDYNLTNPLGKPVNKKGEIPMIISTLPPGTQGSIYKLNTEGALCTGITPNTCTLVYKIPGGGTQSTNPCTEMNSFYDFDKGFCVDKNGNEVTASKSCDSSSLYNKDANDCIPIKPPYFKSLPPNTTGEPGPGDYTNCLTVNGADCQPVYTLGATKSSTNPCSSSAPIYDFKTHTCNPSVKQTQGSTCCEMGINAAASTAACLPYLNTPTPIKNAALCASKPSLCCSSPALATNASCKSQKYWTQTPSFKSGACSVTGFIDIGDDMTMQQKVVQWAEKRKMLNAP